MNIRKLLHLLGALALLTVCHVSAQDYELDVTMGEDGKPSEFFYADERMSVRITPDPLNSPSQYRCINGRDAGRISRSPADCEEGDEVEEIVLTRATVEVVVDEIFEPSTGSSECVLLRVLGRQFPPYSCWTPRPVGFKGPPVELKNISHVIIRDLLISDIRCDLRIAHKTAHAPNQYATHWSINPDADEMEIAKALDLFRQSDECVNRVKGSRARAKERQAEEDRVASRNQRAAQEEDIMLLTNQRLLQCAFDPVCEGKINAGVDRCKETVEGNYMEACIRDINVSP